MSEQFRSSTFSILELQRQIDCGELVGALCPPPSATTSCNTMVAIHFDNGVMIASESKEKDNTQNLFRLHNNIYCAGVGYASDVRRTSCLVKTQLELHYHNSDHRLVPVICALKNAVEQVKHFQSNVFINFLIAGVDNFGVHVYNLHLDGCWEKPIFASQGSGQFVAMAVIEHRWHTGINEDDARELIFDAISTSIKDKPDAGNTIDLCIIRNDLSVEKCSEPITNSNCEEYDIQPESTARMQPNPDWMSGLSVCKETVDVIILSTPTPAPTPVTSPSRSPRALIRRGQLRTTAAQNWLNLKRAAGGGDDDGPPNKIQKQ